MRILGFSKRWDMLSQPLFSTFRLPRKDTDWRMGKELIVLRPVERARLGTGQIPQRGTQGIGTITNVETVRDGFENIVDMTN